MPPKFRGAHVLIGIIANDAARFSEFAACVTNLDVPPGNRIEWVIGGDWCGARNALAQMCVDDGYTHLWFMDDDRAFAPDILMKLLRHDQPLVNPICFTRTWPFQPVTYVEEGALDLASVPDRGLVELHAGGCAGMLIQRDVLIDIDRQFPNTPWFEYSEKSEDVLFCEKAKECGYTLYGDLEARLGHITTAVVWPSFNPEHGWMTGLTIGKDMQVQIPLTADLVNNNIKRIEVPFDEDIPIEEPPPIGPIVGYADPTLNDEPIVEAELTQANEFGVPDPCNICGQQSTWRDMHGQQGCGLHPPDHEAWATFYERAEMWLDPTDNRWYFRLLRGDGSIAERSAQGYTQEAELVNLLSVLYPSVDVFHIPDELTNSRAGRGGPPAHLWNREAT